VYRYNFSTKDLTTVYETIHDAYLPGFSRRILDFRVFEDEQHYIVADKIQHEIVLVDRNTLEQYTLWQGDSITGRTTNYTLQAIPSPAHDKFAILDDSREPILTVVSREGEVLNEFSVIDLPFTQLTWLADNQHVLVTAPGRRLASDIRVYDTVTGKSSPYTDSLRGSYIQNLHACNDGGKWISYIKRMEDDDYQLFTMNLATGSTFQQASFASGTDPFGASTISNQDCSILLQAVPAVDSGTNDIYQTTLNGENLQLLLSNVIAGPFINESSFVYGQPNDSGGYDLYKMSLNDGITTEMLLSNLPTHEAVWAKDIHERGWYVLRKNTWDRTQTQFAAISGDPLVYYDAHSGETHMLTPPDVRIMLFFEVP
jgi:hypothetical protein